VTSLASPTERGDVSEFAALVEKVTLGAVTDEQLSQLMRAAQQG
jgi:hypothetical protein